MDEAETGARVPPSDPVLPAGLDPSLSARRVLSRGQAVGAVVALALLVFCVAVWPHGSLYVGVVAVSVGYAVGIFFKFAVCYTGSRFERTGRITAAQLATMSDADLPVYTVLVPVYREANVIADLVGNLDALDYPKERLQVLVLLEADDEETPAALAAADPPGYFRAIVLPDSQPKTKPKACNVGLTAARGEFLVIYDAEDRPDPDQLKKAVYAFRRSGRRVVCLQAALNYWNTRDNALTRMFTLEYSFWFDYMLPGLYALRMPIPLGGTSNGVRAAHRGDAADVPGDAAADPRHRRVRVRAAAGVVSGAAALGDGRGHHEPRAGERGVGVHRDGRGVQAAQLRARAVGAPQPRVLAAALRGLV
ncbi:glycosyltransferase [Glycomyces dulcitolivorans]|uniref:glycosyltransferase n=1 Tax=Glycomyces dulcitolivorans TaxID=2200759 RepID=UPI000DD4ED58|nr:glycosyltransferase [Glycomyces dulcitolivorans]